MYYRLCETLSDYGTFIPENADFTKHINSKKDFYRSIYLYNEEHKERSQDIIQVTKKGKTYDRPRGILGVKDVYTKELVWDFDDEKNPENALEDTKEMIDRLLEYGMEESNIQVYFSGMKGFAIHVQTDYILTPKEFKYLTASVAEGLKTYDDRIWNPARVIRIPFTKHNESGLFKTPLLPSELDQTIEEIKELASHEYDPDFEVNIQEMPDPMIDLLDGLNQPENSPSEGTESDSKPSENISDLDLTLNTLGLSNWKYALSEGFFPPGTRHEALMALCATYRGLNVSKKKCYYLLKEAVDNQRERFGQTKFPKDELYENILESIYCESWEGGTYSEDNLPEKIKDYLNEQGIPRFSERDMEEDLIIDIEQGMREFYDYAVNIDKNRMRFGIEELDDKLKLQKGHLIGILAPPGIGKTSMAIEIMNNTSKEGVNSYFGSYDMYSKIVIQKLIQRETGLTGDEIFEVYESEDEEQIAKFREILHKNYENVTFCFKVGQTIGDLKASIASRESKIGTPIDLVIVDYIELVRTTSSDPTQASAEAAQGLREIANSGKVVVVLLQPNKMSSTPSEPLLSYNCAKGSSAVAQAVTAMLTCHRPGYDPVEPENDNFFGVNCVKNRMGPLFSVDFSWNGLRGKIGELEDRERQELNDLRKLKKELKEEDF